ncbi:NAD-P-binding protein [Peniophora sp. CONT]|nr:NAD-P-binding protein [Peniophora sp. CONT]
MPAVAPPARALVTGANGFVAAWVVRAYLEEGYSVVGTVRSASKGNHLKKQFASFGDKFEVKVVEDITAPGAFDDAVKGVEIVAHTASPFYMNAKTAHELIDPAVRGTTGVLESILKNGTSVRRVVITSSVAAILNPPNGGALDETSWNVNHPKEVEAKGADASGSAKYCASKALAERSAWDFVQQHQPSWDLVTINPSLVLGPPIHEVSSLDNLNESLKQLYDVLYKNTMDTKALSENWSQWVNVRDVAKAHMLAAKTPAAGGERFILNYEKFYWQDMVDEANDIDSSVPAKGAYGATRGKEVFMTFQRAKAERILGLKFTELHETVRDCMTYFKEFSQKGTKASI